MGLKKASLYGSYWFGVVITLTLSAAVNAQQKSGGAAAAKPTPKAGDEKVDISDLENKYWAPKDTDFSVVQNRTYSKANRFVVAPQWGRVINDPYSQGNVFGLTANYFWSERMGVQATYMKAELSNNDPTSDLVTFGGGVQPDHGKITSYYGVGFNVVPFYAKMSFWGTKIIYFDMAFTPHVGMTSYEQVMKGGNKEKSTLTYGLDVTQFFFFSRNLAVRVDLRNQWRNEEVVKYQFSAGQAEGSKVKDKFLHDTLFLIGPTFYW